MSEVQPISPEARLTDRQKMIEGVIRKFEVYVAKEPLNRYRARFGLPELSQDELQKEIDQMETGDLNVQAGTQREIAQEEQSKHSSTKYFPFYST